mmetsp:Transcript_7776/g.9246  ORF Transcript_7776/g.9246 Transcript_7776/m.9246 type:complete len:150 (+) Transcript_7776:12-461(+)
MILIRTRLRHLSLLYILPLVVKSDASIYSLSYSHSFGRDYCCGDDTRQLYIPPGLDSSDLITYRSASCTDVYCETYRYSRIYSHSFSGCVNDCADKVYANYGDHEGFCNLDDLSCLDDCDIAEWIAAHCACDTGALFASYSFSFAGDES